MRTSSLHYKRLCAALVLAHTFSSALAGFADQLPPLPQPNDISGTVNGCAKAILEHDIDNDRAIRREEYLSFVNNVADLLCLPPRPVLDLELQTAFVTIACLCQELEGNDITCCFEDNAGLYDAGAASAVNRTQAQQSYLRAACLLTQDVLGPQQCEPPSATLAPWAVIGIVTVPPAVSSAPLEEEPNSLLWLLLFLLLPFLCCILCCCVCCRVRQGEEHYEVMVKEEIIVLGPGDPATDPSVTPHEPDMEQALSTPNKAPLSANHPDVSDLAINETKSEKSDEPFSTSFEDKEDCDTTPSQLANRPPEAGGESEESREPLSTSNEDLEAGNTEVSQVANQSTSAGRQGMAVAEGDGDDQEGIGRTHGLKHESADEEDRQRRFRGIGMLRMPPGAAGVMLQHVEEEPNQQGDYEVPERDFHEFKCKSEDIGQELDHYIPDGGVYDPQRPRNVPVIMPTPKYKRKPKPEPVKIDLREERKQLGLGDGEVWEALSTWEEVETERGSVQKIDWVIHSALTAFSVVEETGELLEECSSEEESTDDEEYQDDAYSH